MLPPSAILPRFAALETPAAFCYNASMTLYEALKVARSEEDVKDIYIKVLALKGYTKGEVDIRTSKIWFEAKKGSDWPTYRMFTELCYYVYEAIKRGEALPAFLSVIDSEKAAIMPTAAIEPLLREHGAEVPWGRRASDAPQGAVAMFCRPSKGYFRQNSCLWA